MPVVVAAKKFVEVPSSWEGWAMRVLTVGIVVTLLASWLLLTQVWSLQSQIVDGRAERNAFQTEQTVRLCTVIDTLGVARRDDGCPRSQ